MAEASRNPPIRIRKLISLKEAIARGLDFYYTGRPCPHGHIALREVKRRACTQCHHEKQDAPIVNLPHWRFADLSGQRFGRLLVLPQHESRRRFDRQQIFWLCRCDCGSEKWTLGELLRSGKVLSCGCRKLEAGIENITLNRPGSAKFPGLKSRTPEYQKAYNTAYYVTNKERMIKKHCEWMRSEEGHAWTTAWRAGHYDPQKMAILNRRKYLENPGRYARYNIRRRFRLEQRTPIWADLDAIDRFYRERPNGMHVDHIIPLSGRTVEGYRVDGLHVRANLQYLSEQENNKKRTRMRRYEQNLVEGVTGSP